MSQLYTPPTLIDTITESGDVIHGEWRQIVRNDNNLTTVGRMGSNVSAKQITTLRDNLAEYLVSDAGAVAWQLNYVRRGRI